MHFHIETNWLESLKKLLNEGRGEITVIKIDIPNMQEILIIDIVNQIPI